MENIWRLENRLSELKAEQKKWPEYHCEWMRIRSNRIAIYDSLWNVRSERYKGKRFDD